MRSNKHYDFGDLNKLLLLAREIGVSLRIEYSEADDSMSVAFLSTAASEEFYIKRVTNVDHAIKMYRDHLA